MIRLLIVDDEVLTREILVKYIPWQDIGISEVQEAADGVEALEIAITMRPDIVLCDIKMPRMNGIDLAKQLKEKIPDCKVIFLSVYTDKDYLKSAIQLNAVDYVEKPIDIEEVRNVVAHAVTIVLNEKRKRRELSVDRDGEGSVLRAQSLTLDLTEKEIDPALIGRIEAQDINFPADGDYITIVVKLNHQHGDTAGERNKRISFILQTIIHAFGTEQFDYSTGIKNDEYIIVHICISNTREIPVVKDNLESLKAAVSDCTDVKCKVFVGVGECVSGIKNIRKSYQTALIAIQRQFFTGYNNIVYYKEYDGKIFYFDEDILQQLAGNLKEKKKLETILMIKRLTNDIRQHDNTIVNYVKNCYYKIISQVYRFAGEMNIRIYENDNKKFIWEIISSSYTLDEIEEYLIKLVTFVFDYMENETDNNNIPAKITRYIHENISDADLSIKSIAESLYLTPTYLCLVFKKGTGKTINQYITEIRIEKAKQYLKDKRTRPGEVSSKIGFSNSKYFTKVFKKELGITPSEYKDKELL